MIGNILFPPNSHQMGNMKKASTSLMGRGGLFLKGKRSLASEKRTFFPLYSFGPGGSNHGIMIFFSIHSDGDFTT